MIVRITGRLESVRDNRVVLALAAHGVAHELLVPTYLSRRLASGRRPDGSPAAESDEPVTFHTLEYLESQGQGASFLPRMLAFGSPAERDFFELITSVKGLGNKRAARALAEEPAVIIRAIVERDLKALQRLPEIGRKLAETIVLELKDRVQSLGAELAGAAAPSRAPGPLDALVEPRIEMSPQAEEAVIVVMALGQTRSLAERMVEAALRRHPQLATTNEIVSAACTARI